MALVVIEVEMKLRTISVSKLNEYIKRLIQSDPILQNIAVTGEISNLTLHSSGHAYFALKDEGGKVSAVMFRTSVSKLTKTPQNGDSVTIKGRIGVYEKTGQYQLYADEMIFSGSGDLHIAFEALKKSLSEKGYFDDDRKKTIPKSPQRIGVITSPTGAAIRDVLSVIKRRTSLPEVVLYPVHVQGEYAVGDVKNAFAYFKEHPVDTIILTRGGGSIEELWAFNELEVAQAIYECEIPVISGVGHETDFTISDFISDLRVPTPSAAAECVTQGDEEKRLIMEQYKTRILRQMKLRLNQSHLQLERASMRSLEQKLTLRLTQYRYDIEQMKDSMVTRVSTMEDTNRVKLDRLADQLEYLSPMSIIRRGYTMTTNKDQQPISSVEAINVGDQVSITFSDGHVKAVVQERKTNHGS